MSIAMPLGPLIVGIDGQQLDGPTAEMLGHPAVGGVILFSRNYVSRKQLQSLTASIRALRAPRLVITVDQEGGRVQRFREGFTRLPPLAVLGRWFRSHPDRARDLAYRHGRVMAAEVLDAGVDLSWAPVLDLNRDSTVIGDRAMDSDPETVTDLAAHYIAGMRDAGMAACAKHFPGHGSVYADSHHEVVIDQRPLERLDEDLAPFVALANRFQAVMMAHVCYPALDASPAGFSSAWIGQRLRVELGFEGLVVSDDLDMFGAAPAGGLRQRLEKAFVAGCDLALVCKPDSVRKLLKSEDLVVPVPDAQVIGRLYGRPMSTLDEQLTVPEFRAWRESLEILTRDQ
jgi:beta-N-acetylhexosaminidase